MQDNNDIVYSPSEYAMAGTVRTQTLMIVAQILRLLANLFVVGILQQQRAYSAKAILCFAVDVTDCDVHQLRDEQEIPTKLRHEVR